MSALEFVGKAVKGAAKLLRGSKGTAKEAAEGMVKITGESAKEVASLTKGAASGSTKVAANTTKGVLDATGGMAKSSAKMGSHEVAAAKEAYASRAIKSIGNPSYKVEGVLMPNRFSYRGGMFIDAKRSRIFNIQEFGRLQSRYRSLYGSARSGYLSFEKSLPKAQLFGFNKAIPKVAEGIKPVTKGMEKTAATAEKTGKTAVEAVTKHPYVKPSITIKPMEKAAKAEVEATRAEAAAASRTAGNATGRAAENVTGKVGENAGNASGISKQQLYSDAKKGMYNLGKAGAKGMGSAIAHPGAILGWIMFLKLQNKGLIDKTLDEFEKGGLYNVAMGAGFGGNAQNVQDKVSNTVSGLAGEGIDLYQGLKGTVTSVVDEFGNGYDFIKNKFVGYNGMVNDGNGQYVDPSVQQYQALQSYLQQNPETAQLVQEHPELANMYLQQQSQMGGGGASQIAGNLASGAVSGVNALMSNFTGGNVQKMDVASLLLSGLLFFGRFGLLGKIASAAMAGMTLKNVNGRTGNMVMQPQANLQQQLNAYFRQAQQAQQQQEPEPREETPSVFRARM